MIIQIESFAEVAEVAGGISALVVGVSTLHWKAFLAPRLERIFQPYRESVEAMSRVIETKYPIEYEAARDSVARDRKLRAAI